jgi:hypothetical protein
MKNIAITLLIFIVLSLGDGCEKDVNNPTPQQSSTGKRDYIFTIDTLTYPGSFQIDMKSMWASSPNDVYVVGHNDDAGPGTIFHYGGNGWQPSNFHTRNGGPISGEVTWYSVYGTNSNDVWIAGARTYQNIITGKLTDSGLVIRYDGVQWREYMPGVAQPFYALWEGSPTNVWVAGSNGLVMHFDGSKWEKHNLGEVYYINSLAGLPNGKMFIIGNIFDQVTPVDSDAAYLFEFNDSTWRQLDSIDEKPSAPPQRFGYFIFHFGGSLYSSGLGVFEYEDGEWNTLLCAQVRNIWRKDARNIFAVGKAVYNYNGRDWYEYAQFRAQQWIYYGCYTDGNEAFILGSNGYKSFIIHGK